MGNVFYWDWEIRFMEWLQSFESGFTTAVATSFTMMGEEYLMVLVLGLLYWCYKKELGHRVGLTIIGGAMFGSMIKSLAMRRRPYMDNPGIKCIRASDPDADSMQIAAQGYSFPSLHALMSSSLCSSVAIGIRKKWVTVLAVILPFFIGLSRNYLGVHYPTDVLTGWAIGLGMTFLIGLLEKKVGYKGAYGIVIALGTVGVFYCRDNEFFTLYGILIGLLAGFIYEEKYVRFENAAHWQSYLIRPVLGVVIFVSVSSLLKLPLKALTLPADHLVTLLLRSLRYAVSVFVIIGLYPRCFRKERKQ